jgi:sugar phosphate isomerase/epimerase
MRLVFNANSTMHLPVRMHVRLARETGWDGIFIRAEHVERYLSQGYPVDDLREALSPLSPINLGAVVDVERWQPAERRSMLAEAGRISDLAVAIGASYVQLLSGPVQLDGPYRGPAALSSADLRRATADGLRAVADLGAEAGIRYYLEPLAWSPLAGLTDAVAAIEEADRGNVGLVLDFWHLWHAGTTPDEIAAVDRRLVFGVDVGDSLGPRGSGRSGDQATRRVWPGEGEIPLREYVDAILAIGFDGWWDNELYSPLHWETDDPWAIGAGLKVVLESLLRA